VCYVYAHPGAAPWVQENRDRSDTPERTRPSRLPAKHPSILADRIRDACLLPPPPPFSMLVIVEFRAVLRVAPRITNIEKGGGGGRQGSRILSARIVEPTPQITDSVDIFSIAFHSCRAVVSYATAMTAAECGASVVDGAPARAFPRAYTYNSASELRENSCSCFALFSLFSRHPGGLSVGGGRQRGRMASQHISTWGVAGREAG